MAISEISKNALTVLEKRYLAKDEEGNLTETVEGMFRRVADTIAAVDATYDNTCDTKALSDDFFFDDRPSVPAEFADPDERRARPRPAIRVLCSSGRGRHGGDF